MKKFTTMLEDLWVVITFAEASVIYETDKVQDVQPHCQNPVSTHTV